MLKWEKDNSENDCTFQFPLTVGVKIHSYLLLFVQPSRCLPESISTVLVYNFYGVWVVLFPFTHLLSISEKKVWKKTYLNCHRDADDNKDNDGDGYGDDDDDDDDDCNAIE